MTFEPPNFVPTKPPSLARADAALARLPGSDPGADSIGRRQRAALADLVELSNVSDRTERAIAARLAERVAWLTRRRERTLERADARCGDLRPRP